MLLQTIQVAINVYENEDYTVMIKKYKAKGVIKKYNDCYRFSFEDFEWIRERI
jgi:hypothetical protein